MREAPTGYRVANGVLELDTGAGEIDDTAPNLIGQPVPATHLGGRDQDST